MLYSDLNCNNEDKLLPSSWQTDLVIFDLLQLVLYMQNTLIFCYDVGFPANVPKTTANVSYKCISFEIYGFSSE